MGGANVVVSHGKDVAQDQRLKIDLTTGMDRFVIEARQRRRSRTRGATALIQMTPTENTRKFGQPTLSGT